MQSLIYERLKIQGSQKSIHDNNGTHFVTITTVDMSQLPLVLAMILLQVMHVFWVIVTLFAPLLAVVERTFKTNCQHFNLTTI